MDLHAFIHLFLNRKNLVFILIGGALAAAFLAYRLQSQQYEGEMLLSIARQGMETSLEYQFDQSYRLQADERMAETVAQYLATAIAQQEVVRQQPLSVAGEAVFMGHKISALRLSSSLIKVTYRALTPNEAERIAEALADTGERYVAALNEQAGAHNWFTLVSSEPVIIDGRFTLLLALGLGLGAGLLAALWGVLGAWYWRGAASTDTPQGTVSGKYHSE